MKSSDSESECFESAEEDFDESEEENTKSTLNNAVSPREVTTPVENKSSKSDNKPERSEGFESSVKFRKKPKGLSQLANIPPLKFQFASKKSPTSESIFKTEKIAPDAFFQDITRNLSQNINKSINTLQQTSSNVKDLILGSLPVPTADDKESFSYDDKDDCSSSISEDEVLDSNSRKSEEVETVPSDIKEIEPQKNIVKLEDKNINMVTIDEVKPKFNEQKEILTESLLENVEDICFKNDSSESLNETIKVNEKEIILKSELKENLNLEEFIKNESTEVCNLNKQITNLPQEFEEKVFLAESAIKNYETKQHETISSHLSVNESDKDDSLVCQIDADDKSDKGVEGKKDVEINNSNCKVVEMTIDDEKNKGEEALHEKTSQSENIKESDCGDGWDDFDFSDNEFENNEVEKATSENFIEPRNILEKPTEENKSNKAKKQDRLESTELKDSVASSQKNAKVMETTETTDDDWGWDNWEDEPANENVKSENKQNENARNEKNDLLDEKKWSDVLTKQEEVNWNIGSWGVNMLLNKATAVTQGISNALEAGLGAPDPETLARMELAERQKMKEVEDRSKESSPLEKLTEVTKKNSLTDVNIFPGFGITNLVAEVTSKIVEHSKIQEIGSKVITGGLDTLETFGKKTMEVLQEGDPGLKNKRALFMSSNKPVLSQVLREAREKADKELRKSEEKEISRKCHFETVFDDFQGMVNLEALEMLSRQCELKLEQIRSQMSAEDQEDLDGILEEVEQLCALDDCEISPSSMIDFKTSLKMAIEPLKNELNLQKIYKIHEEAEKWFQFIISNKPHASFIHQKVVAALAELTAVTVHQFHKAGELLSVKECRKTVEEVEALSKMTGVLCAEISKIGETFIKISKDSLQNQTDTEEINSLVEKVNIIVKNSTTYIRQAFNLLIPVLQIGAAV